MHVCVCARAHGTGTTAQAFLGQLRQYAEVSKVKAWGKFRTSVLSLSTSYTEYQKALGVQG